MNIRVAINGYGRIGRDLLKALYEYAQHPLTIVAINDPNPVRSMVHLSLYDTSYGRSNLRIGIDGDNLLVENDLIYITHTRDINELDWASLDIDVVIECTGSNTERELAQLHIDKGAKLVIVSAPSANADITIVYGVNHQELNNTHKIVSSASCTTNCVAPILNTIIKHAKIESGFISTIHAFTKDQNILDAPHRDLRRSRAASASIIPTNTGAAEALYKIFPDLKGRLIGIAYRVPVPHVSLAEVNLNIDKEVDVDTLNSWIIEESLRVPHIMHYDTNELVSSDFVKQRYSSIVDVALTKSIGKSIKICAWYDNEWGFANRLLDLAAYIYQVHNNDREIRFK